MKNSRIEGILPPIPTTFLEEEVDLAGISENLKKWLATGLSGFVVLGSNGEANMLEEEEQVRVVDAVRKVVPQDRWMIVGMHRQSIRQALVFLEKVSEKKVDAVLILPPNFYRPFMNRSSLVTFYRKLADESPVPILIYNMPKYTGINISSDIVCELSAHDRIVGIKDSSGNIVQIGEIIRDTSPDFSVLAGSGSFLLPTLLLGGQGAVAAVANVAPEQCLDIFRLHQCGNISEAAEVQLRILRLNRAVTSQYGVAGLKMALDLRGMCGGLPRSPLLPLEKEGMEDIREILRKLNLLCPL